MRGTVLVTGGAGYIGSHACKALAAAGYRPVVYDNLTNGHAGAVRWGPSIVADLRDRERLAEAFARWKPIAVLHFAASIEAGESVVDPLRFYGNNVAGTIALLRAMVVAQVRYIVFSSTAAVYGEPQAIPIPEDHPTRPSSPYGRSKLMIEEILRDAVAAHDLAATVLRYFNAAGADPDGVLGENHSPETHLIPLAVQAALGLREELTVFGADYDTPDGTCIRDYVHVADLANAHVLALNRLLAGGASVTANLGTGQGHSVLQVLACVQDALGRPVPYYFANRRPGDPACLVAEVGRAPKELGWRPKYPLLSDQVEDCAAWTVRHILRMRKARFEGGLPAWRRPPLGVPEPGPGSG